MRLIGSKTEQEFRDVLVSTHRGLFVEGCYSRLLDTLRTNFPYMQTAYIIDWGLDQGEEIYVILINTSVIAKIEVDRYDHNISPLVDTMTVADYTKRLKQMDRIKLAVALNLAENDLKR